MKRARGWARRAFVVVAGAAMAGQAARAQVPDLPAAPKNAPQDSGALRVQVQGTLSEAMKNDPVLEAKTKSLASQLRCPVCQGLSIQDSPSELSQQMRTVVKEQLATGKSEQDVRDYFISKYGEWILLEPQAHGFNTLVYALPALLVLGGIAFLVVIVKKWTAATATDGGGMTSSVTVGGDDAD